MTRRVFWFLVTIILLTAACLRLWQLQEYPPGPHYDEAAEVLITRSIAFGGADHFPIVESYQGREALFYYLNAPLFHLIHDGVFTLQLSNVFMSLLTTAAAITLGRAMFAGRRGQIVAMAAGALMTLSFPLLLMARQAFRTPALPLLQTLALLCLWQGLKRGGSRWLVAGGFFAGCALYTYMASRLFPLWLLIGGLLLIALDQARRGLRLRQGVIFFGALALTALPMALYAIQKPDIFLGRLYEVTQPGQSITLVESIRLHLRMFFIQGEILLRYNLPGRPYFTWPEGALLLTGFGVALRRLLRAGRAIERAAYGLALLAPFMILPSVISVGGFPPNHMRSVGMVPLVFIQLGVGFEVVWGRVMRALRTRAVPPQAAPLITAVVIIFCGVLVGQVYFGWASRADLYYDADADLAAATEWLPQHISDHTRVYVASQHLEHPTVLIANLPDVTWLGQTMLFRPPPGRDGIVIFPRSAPPPEDWAAWLAPYALADVPPGPDGRPAFEAFRLTGDAPLPELLMPAEPARNGLLTLLGYHASPIFPGAAGEIVLNWQVDQTPPQADLTPVLQLEDHLGSVLARAETPFIQTNRWQAGETLMHRLTVRVPVGTPPGNYPVRLTWVARANEQYLPFDEGSVWAQVGEVEVLRPVHFPDADALSIPNRQTIEAAPGVRLLGWGSLPVTRRPGESIDLTLYWQGVGDTRADAHLQPVLMGARGESRLEQSPSQYPASRWADGEIVRENVRWSIPRYLIGGRYGLSLRVGETQINLGTLEIAGIPRLFDAPAAGQVIETELGEAFQLYGYTLAANGTIQLELIWQALAENPTDYTVFVHLVDASGQIIAQRDTMPVNNTYPTSLWAAGEFVIDLYTFADVPPGRYTLRAGLYDQMTGVRLALKKRPQEDFIDLGTVTIEA